MHLSPEALAGYLDQDLPDEEQTRVELHLASCTECRQELAEVRGLQLHRRRRWFLALVPAAAVAAALAVIVLPRQAPVPSEVRAGPSTELPLEIVSPAPSDVVVSSPVTFTGEAPSRCQLHLHTSGLRMAAWSGPRPRPILSRSCRTASLSVRGKPGSGWWMRSSRMACRGRPVSNG
jgi:anti-sigma factor RsiW